MHGRRLRLNCQLPVEECDGNKYVYERTYVCKCACILQVSVFLAVADKNRKTLSIKVKKRVKKECTNKLINPTFSFYLIFDGEKHALCLFYLR